MFSASGRFERPENSISRFLGPSSMIFSGLGSAPVGRSLEARQLGQLSRGAFDPSYPSLLTCLARATASAPGGTSS